MCLFSTGAIDVRLPLQEIIAYIPNVFPVLACIVKHNASTAFKIVTLKGDSIASVMVAEPLTVVEPQVPESLMVSERTMDTSTSLHQLQKPPTLFIPYNLPQLDVFLLQSATKMLPPSEHPQLPACTACISTSGCCSTPENKASIVQVDSDDDDVEVSRDLFLKILISLFQL